MRKLTELGKSITSILAEIGVPLHGNAKEIATAAEISREQLSRWINMTPDGETRVPPNEERVKRILKAILQVTTFQADDTKRKEWEEQLQKAGRQDGTRANKSTGKLAEIYKSLLMDVTGLTSEQIDAVVEDSDECLADALIALKKLLIR